MIAITFGFSGLLIAFGVGVWAATGADHVTPLIPAFVGGVFLLLAAVGLKPSLRMHTMHAAVALGLLGGLGSLVRFAQIIGTDGVSVKTISVLGLGVILLAYVGFGVKSFIDARKQRKLEAATNA